MDFEILKVDILPRVETEFGHDALDGVAVSIISLDKKDQTINIE